MPSTSTIMLFQFSRGRDRAKRCCNEPVATPVAFNGTTLPANAYASFRREDSKMYCTRCGTQLNDTAKFCSDCGHAMRNPATGANYHQTEPRLARPREGRKLAGVCAGLARYMEVDVTLVRLIALILVFVPPFPAVIGYIIAWIVMPNDPLPVVNPYPAGSR